ncbi:fibronectin type III domain-containing protein, partial [archaeon]|nr:fibronectin type III domain-containing protein [archaeon]
MGNAFAASITDFTNTGVTDTTASFSWTAAEGATSVNIQYSLNQSSWSGDTVVDVGASSGTVTDLTQGTLYYFRLNVSGGINDGISNIVSATPIPDLTAYTAALAAVVEEDYTSVTWTEYQTIVAENVVTDQNTQAEVDTATSNITTAQGDLVEIADLTNYTAALAAVTEADYTTVTWEAYELILAANVVTDQNTQAEVDTATSNITTAQGDLVEIADLTNYT